MSDSETEQTGEHASCRTGQRNECRRCGWKQRLVSKYGISLYRQYFRKVARKMGFKRYR